MPRVLQQQNPLTQNQTSPLSSPSAVGIKITSHTNGQNVSTGELTISGTSSDNSDGQCQVYVDWNDKKPFQRAIATGPGGNADYSLWRYTYTSAYHPITNGTNELTSKPILYC